MMVKPRESWIFRGSGKVMAGFLHGRQDRMVKLICFKIEANRNVGPGNPHRRRHCPAEFGGKGRFRDNFAHGLI
jgi:hypothetical protein